jgi:hypothetical protein
MGEERERHPYFRTPERIAALHAQLVEWRGTRWAHAGVRPNEMRCGVSGDCLFWVHVFKAIGALPATVEVPEYIRGQALRDAMRSLRSAIEATDQSDLVYYGSAGSLIYHPGSLSSRAMYCSSVMARAVCTAALS